MRPLSASEAISPALERNQCDLLARPFRWQTFFKIAAVAFFAEIGGGGSFNLPSRGGGIHDLPAGLIAFIVAFAIIIGLISLVIGLILFYLGSRLQLVAWSNWLPRGKPRWRSIVWRRASQATWRWIGLKLLFFFAILALLALLAMPFLVSAVRHHAWPSFDMFHIGEIILLVVAALLLLLIAFAGYVLLRDFALPYIALEDVSIPRSAEPPANHGGG